MIITNLFVFSRLQYTNSNNRIPTASSPANTNSSSSSNTNGGASLQSSNQPTTSSPSSECQSAPPAQQLSKTNLYIRGLSQNTMDKDLITMCSQWVPIIYYIITIRYWNYWVYARSIRVLHVEYIHNSTIFIPSIMWDIVSYNYSKCVRHVVMDC